MRLPPRSSSFCALPSPLRAEGNDDTDKKQRFFGRAKVSLPKARKVRFSAATAEPPARLEFATNHQPNYAQVRSMGYTSLARSAGRRQQARHAEHGPKNWGFSQPRYFLFGAAELSQKPVRACQRAPKRGHFFSCLAAALESPPNASRWRTHTPKEISGAPRPRTEGCGIPAPIFARSVRRRDAQQGQRVANSAQPKRAEFQGRRAGRH